MAIKRYIATKDNTITNAFKENLSTRGTGSNMGASDILEVFSIYGQNSFSSSASGQNTRTTELSRVLLEFPVSGSSVGQIYGDRLNNKIPASGSVNFILKISNARHSETVPTNVTFNVQAISASWNEGSGLDMENYLDKDNSNWLKRNSSNFWLEPGGDFHTASYVPGTNFPMYTATLKKGIEDIELDITTMVEEWIDGRSTVHRQNYGIGLYLTSSQEAFFSSSSGLTSGSIPHNPSGSTRSYYTKRFFARGSQFFFKRPVIEARWDSSKKDDRNNFHFSSSLAPASDNLNSLYLYNNIKGQLKDIGGNSSTLPVLKLYSGTTSSPNAIQLTLKHAATNADITSVTSTRISTGIYSASFALTSSDTTTYVWDVWEVGGAEVHTGSSFIQPKSINASSVNSFTDYRTKITNLKSEYSTDEKANFRIFIRAKDWSPTIYTVASAEPENTIVEDAYFKIFRVQDSFDIINYGTGSTQHTRLSHDISGSYFDLDMSILEPDYMYGIKFLYKVNDDYQEQPEVFRFRIVEKDELQ